MNRKILVIVILLSILFCGCQAQNKFTTNNTTAQVKESSNIIIQEDDSSNQSEYSPNTASNATERDVVVWTEKDDPNLKAAKEKAIKELDFFIKFLNEFKDDSYFIFSMKKDFIENGVHEHMWVEITDYKNNIFYGTLNNNPQLISNVKFNDPVSIKVDEIEDWIIYNGYEDQAVGGWSINVLVNETTS